jgi:hypothetical protein
MIIGVVMITNEIDQCTTIRLSDKIQQKSIKNGEKNIRIPMIMDEMDDRINRLLTRD